MNLDNLDWKILAELDNDARAPNTRIAKKLRTNKNVVNYRIQNLEKKGIIRGYYTIINAYKLGYQGYRLYLRFQYTDTQKEKEIMEYFIKQKNNWWISYLKGNWNMAILSWFRNQRELVGAMNEFFKQYRDFVEDYQLVVYYGIKHYRLPFTKKYLMGGAKKECMQADEKIETDKTEIEILKYLSTNGKASLIAIANKVNLTPSAVKYRIKQLLNKGIVLGFRPIFDIKKLGYLQYKLDINVKDTSIIEKIGKFAEEHDNVFYLDQTLGYADVELEVYVNDEKEFFQIIRDIRDKFSGNIKDHRFFLFEEITKIEYMP
ncbi:MAG: winged helix-turn-helix transcriptional regulator [Candidatus Micrarchaeota archaeon]